MSKLMALFAFVVFLGFIGILVFSVPEIDLMVVAGITVALVGFDFLTSKG